MSWYLLFGLNPEKNARLVSAFVAYLLYYAGQLVCFKKQKNIYLMTLILLSQDIFQSKTSIDSDQLASKETN